MTIKTVRKAQEDKFFIYRDAESLDWIYFNSDSNCGGSYVINNITANLILEAEESTITTKGFFKYIEECGKQYYLDRDEEDADYIYVDCLFSESNIIGNKSTIEDTLVLEGLTAKTKKSLVYWANHK